MPCWTRRKCWFSATWSLTWIDLWFAAPTSRSSRPWPTNFPRCRTNTTPSSRTSTRRRCEFHHDKHHKAYVDGLNAALGKLEEARKSGRLRARAALRAARRVPRRGSPEPRAVLGQHEAGRRRRADGRGRAIRSSATSACSKRSRGAHRGDRLGRRARAGASSRGSRSASASSRSRS